MRNQGIKAWLAYHRVFSKVSMQRLALATGRSLRVLERKIEEPEKLTLGDVLTMMDELSCNRDSRLDFFKEVMSAWDKKSSQE